jgi:DNA primase
LSNLVDLVREDFGISGSGRWYRSDVHSSLVVDSEKELFFFNSRGLKGDTLDYLVQVRGLPLRTAQDMINHASAGMPVNVKQGNLQAKFEKLVDLFYSAGRKDREYWYNRKLTDATIDRYRLGNFEGWNLIPIYDEGLFLNFQCRRDNPDKRIRFWYKDKDFKPVLFNKEILPFIDLVYITEGMVDCILLNQLGLPCICSTNGADSWNTGWVKYFNKIKDVFYIADNDKAGVFGAKLVADAIGLYKVRILRFKEEREKYGAADFFKSGGTVDEFKSIIETNSVFGFEKELI